MSGDIRTIPIGKIAELLGGDVRGGEVLCPGPGHSTTDRSLSVKTDAHISEADPARRESRGLARRRNHPVAKGPDRGARPPERGAGPAPRGARAPIMVALALFKDRPPIEMATMTTTQLKRERLPNLCVPLGGQ